MNAPATPRCLRNALALSLGAALLLAFGAPLRAQGHAASAGSSYRCVDDKGQPRVSDRPIRECNDREQTILNKDGSVRGKLPPTLTADERAEREAAERRQLEARAALNDEIRKDRNLKARFPNEAAHNKAREAALDPVRRAMKNSEQRLQELRDERKPLLNEAEFYKGKALPAKLKQQIEGNDAAAAAQREAIQNQEAEVVRINKLFDIELERLRRLWNGAQPGTLGSASAHQVNAELARR